MIGDIEALTHELDRLRRKQQLLEALMRLAQLPDVGEDDVRDEALNLVADLSDSEAAFFFLVNEQDGTLDAGVWSDGSPGNDRVVIRGAGVWAQAALSPDDLVAGEGPFSESALADLDYGSAVQRFVSTPISAQGEVVAVGGVVNKPGPYTEEDRRQVSMLMHSMWTIIQHKKAERLLKEFDYDDALTGLANRDRFDQQLRIEVRRADRAGVGLGLVIIDLDDFTAFNAVEGRAAGDRVLKRSAVALQESFIRAGELIARIDADAFALVLPATDITDAGAVAERAREAIEALGIDHPSSDTSDKVTASVGIAVHEPRSGRSPEAVLTSALAGLDEARRAGGNLVGSELPEL